MGLDMYLKAERFISGYPYEGNKDIAEFAAVLSALGLTRNEAAKGAPTITVNVTVAYWRKANAIHGWFVENVQGGEDECDLFDVSREQLTDLKDRCANVLADHSKAALELPPVEGFFFGSTEIDEGYFSDLEDTVRQLTAILDNPKLEHMSFGYRASW